jgi:hypothetical protein
MPGTNISMLQTVAEGLGKLKNDVVFVGGSVAELYASNPELSDIRPTQDVDCVIELPTRVAHAKLEDDLRALGFAHDTSKGAPICRWIYKDILVDVMPSDSNVLGFSNMWYEEGIENKISTTLPNGTKIFVFTPEYYLASKFEAHKGRGGNDLRQSYDFEDIVYLFENCDELFESIRNSNAKLRNYLKTECANLMANEQLIEGVECVMQYGGDSDSTEMIVELIEKIMDIE